MTEYNLAIAGSVGAFGVYDGDSALQTAASNYSNTVTMSQVSVDRPNEPFVLSKPDYYIEVKVDLNSFVTGTQSVNGDNSDNNLDDVFGLKGFTIDSSLTAAGQQAEFAADYWQFMGKPGNNTSKAAQAATITFEGDGSDVTVGGGGGSANTVLLVNYIVASDTGKITVEVDGLWGNGNSGGDVTTTIVDNLQKQQIWKATQPDLTDLDGSSTSNGKVVYPKVNQGGTVGWDTSGFSETVPTAGAGNDIDGLGDDSISVPSSFYTDVSLHEDFSDDLVSELVDTSGSKGSSVDYLQVVESFNFTVNASNVESDGDPDTTPDARHNQLSEFARYKVANGDSSSSTLARQPDDVNSQLLKNMPAIGEVGAGFPLFNDGDRLILCTPSGGGDYETELNSGLELGDEGSEVAAASASTSNVTVLVPSALEADGGSISAASAGGGKEGFPLFEQSVGIVLKQVANWSLLIDGSKFALPSNTAAWVYDSITDNARWQQAEDYQM